MNDRLGNAVLYTDSNGGVVQRRVFGPFGQLVGSPSGSEPTQRLFTGQRYDEVADLYDFQARWYDPGSGTFLSVDPARHGPHPAGRGSGRTLSRLAVNGASSDVAALTSRLRHRMVLTQPQLLNSYSYARNNPISYVDPDGAVPVPLALGGVGAAFGFGVEAGAQIQSGQIDPMALLEATLLGATVGLGLGITFELGLATLGLEPLIPGGATAVLDAFAVAVILGVASGMSGVEIEKLLRDLGGLGVQPLADSGESSAPENDMGGVAVSRRDDHVFDVTQRLIFVIHDRAVHQRRNRQ